MKRLILYIIPLIFLLTACSTPTTNTSQTDAAAYIENKGSDTIVNLALAWAERYQGEHPDVRISVTGGGSGTGIAALINNTVDIANASRKIKAEELDEAKVNGIDQSHHRDHQQAAAMN